MEDRAAEVDLLWDPGRPGRILASGDCWWGGYKSQAYSGRSILETFFLAFTDRKLDKVGIDREASKPKPAKQAKGGRCLGKRDESKIDSLAAEQGSHCAQGQSATSSQSQRRPTLRAVRGRPIPQLQTTTQRLFHTETPPSKRRAFPAVHRERAA